jgi:hypothetical protein
MHTLIIKIYLFPITNLKLQNIKSPGFLKFGLETLLEGYSIIIYHRRKP